MGFLFKKILYLKISVFEVCLIVFNKIFFVWDCCIIDKNVGWFELYFGVIICFVLFMDVFIVGFCFGILVLVYFGRFFVGLIVSILFEE